MLEQIFLLGADLLDEITSYKTHSAEEEVEHVIF